MQLGGFPGIVGITKRDTFFFIVGSVSIALGKIDRYFYLLARRETIGLDENYDGIVASLLDASDTVEVRHDLTLSDG